MELNLINNNNLSKLSMLDAIPTDVLIHIVNYLDYRGIYNLLFVKQEFHDELGREFKRRFYYKKVQKLINKDLSS